MDIKKIKAERLRAARAKAGYTDAAKAARAFWWKEAAYRHHENETRGFGPDAAKKYGKAFKVKAGWLLAMDGVDDQPPSTPETEDSLIVNGSVAAGVWRESEHWDDDRTFEIQGMPPLVPGAKRFGLVVEGLSMDRHYEPGTVLDCVSIFNAGVKPASGDHVIVEQVRPDGLRELTVKEYEERDGRYFLVPKSSRPEFKPLEYDGPDEEHDNDGGIHVIGYVMGAIPPHSLRLLKRMGLIKTAR